MGTPRIVKLAGGATAVVDENGRAQIVPADEADQLLSYLMEPPTCGMCDGYHRGVCPFEEDPNREVEPW